MVRYREIVSEAREDTRSDHDIKNILYENFTVQGRVTIDSKGTVNIDGQCLSHMQFKHFPVIFNTITGEFYIKNDSLESLIGSPRVVKKRFSVEADNLESLVGGPKIVYGDYTCISAKLISLQGLPDRIKQGGLYLSQCPLITLEEIEKITTDISQDISISYYDHLALLRLLSPDFTHSTTQVIFEEEPVPPAVVIIQKYLKKLLVDRMPWKRAIIECQYELIKAGFKGNAKW